MKKEQNAICVVLAPPDHTYAHVACGSFAGQAPLPNPVAIMEYAVLLVISNVLHIRRGVCSIRSTLNVVARHENNTWRHVAITKGSSSRLNKSILSAGKRVVNYYLRKSPPAKYLGSVKHQTEDSQRQLDVPAS